MPELPEVEIAARQLRMRCAGKKVESVTVADARILGDLDAETFRAALIGRVVDEVGRHGKHVIAPLSEAGLWWIHLGMSGKLLWRSKSEELPPHTRVSIGFADGTVCFRDPRIFGRTAAGPVAEVRARGKLDELGPDAERDVRTPKALIDALGDKKRPIKVALMDQASLAGLGNIQASEALFRAGIHPKTSVPEMKRGAFIRLLKGMHDTLEHTLEVTEPSEGKEVEYMSDGVHAANPFSVYGQAGEPCPTCKTTKIQEFKQAGRKTFYCPTCQPESA